jgi:hypothetical protein
MKRKKLTDSGIKLRMHHQSTVRCSNRMSIQEFSLGEFVWMCAEGRDAENRKTRFGILNRLSSETKRTLKLEQKEESQ